MNTNDKLKLAAEIGVELPHYTNTDNPIDFPVRGANRIKELARQAGYKDLPTVRLAFQGFDKEKFAELIVRECARTASMFSVENKRIHPDIDPKDMPLANQMVYHSTCQCVAQEIKELFGVE